MSIRAEMLAFDRAPAAARQHGLGTELFAFDRMSVRTYDADRRLHVEVCNISKATVNPYYGREIPGAEELGLDPDKLYKLWRHPDELEKAAPTFARLQLLDTHTAVDAENPKLENTCGTVGSDVRFETPYLKASLAIWTQDAINRILSKQSAQLSCSYRYTADMTPGTTPEGLAYHGVMRHIIANHVALVKEGRAGPDVFVNDALPIGLSNMFKFPKLIEAIAKVVTLSNDQRLALDAAFESKANDEDYESAMDARECALDEREEAMDAAEKDEVAKGDRKKARDKRASDRAKRASDRASDRAKDSDPVLEDKEKKLKGGAQDSLPATGVSKDEAERMAKDAADAAVARVTATHQALRDVTPLVGQITVAMDSAAAVYRFALDQVKVPYKDVHESALGHLVAAEIRARTASTATQSLATDAVPAEANLNHIFRAA